MFLISLMSTIAKVISAHMPGDQSQTVLLNGEPLENVDKFKYLGSMFVANGQSTEDIRGRINLARSAFSRLQSCHLSWREMAGYKGQGLPGSGAIDSARRRIAGGLRQ